MFDAIYFRVASLLRKQGYLLQRLPQSQHFQGDIPFPEHYAGPEHFWRFYRPWLAPEFDRLLTQKITENTMLPKVKLYMLLSLLKQTRLVEGDILEAGVWKGGSAQLMVNYLNSGCSKKEVWLLDTFAGYDEINPAKDCCTAHDGIMLGKSADEIREVFSNEKVRIHVVEGAIPETLRDVSAKQIAFAHIDVNLYNPTLAVTQFCLERMPKGGIIVFDDYGWPETYGARVAIDEVCADFGHEVISVPETTQAFLIRV
ncbi:MAG: TylF/MycF/NovP-related O-methyltransferase [Chthoniobacteraceae bacterium]